jgi:hypothetical protein
MRPVFSAAMMSASSAYAREMSIEAADQPPVDPELQIGSDIRIKTGCAIRGRLGSLIGARRGIREPTAS